jgi:hypothetical protein
MDLITQMNAVYKALLGSPATLDTLAVASTLLVVAAGSLLAYLLFSRPSAPAPAAQTTSTAEEVPTATASSLKKPGPYRRPLARSQRHDSSSTLPPPSAPLLTASSTASTSIYSSRGRRSSLADTASLTGFSVSNRTTSIAASKQQVEEGDDIGAVAPDPGVQPETPPAPQSAAPAAEEQLFVPLAAAATRPLQAVSAPLSGLPLSPSSSQGVVSMQSLSDPTVSVVQTRDAQLPASVALQAATQAAQQQSGAAGAAGAGSRKGPATDATGTAPSSRGRQQHDSAPAVTLDLAAVLAHDPRAAAGRMLPAAAAVVSAGPTPSPAAPTARLAPPTPLGVRPIGTCLPAAPWSPGNVGAAAGQGAAGSATSNLLYGAAPARPLPTSSLYKSPLAHVTLSVKVCSLRRAAACMQVKLREAKLPGSIPSNNEHEASALLAAPLLLCCAVLSCLCSHTGPTPVHTLSSLQPAVHGGAPRVGWRAAACRPQRQAT